MSVNTFTPSHRGGSGKPLLCVHGFVDTWRTWELVLPTLERRYDVLAPTLPGHAGGPPAEPNVDAVLDVLEAAMDDAGFATAHVCGNSLGGYLALRLAERGRADSVVALAPAGGWADDDPLFAETHVPHFTTLQQQAKAAVPHVDAIVRTPEGRRRATELITTRYEHIPAELIAHQIEGVAACDAVESMLAAGLRDGWPLDAERIACPVRIVWGTDDRILPWPSAAVRYRAELPNADWVELDGVGHCPQLDVPVETAELIAGFATV